MRVLISGSNHAKINKIAVTTFLDGLYYNEKDSLYVIFTGSGYISSIVEEWVDKTWPGAGSRNCFNGDWFMKHWSGEDGLEGAGYDFVEETNPDLIFLFGNDEYKFHYPARHKDIPIYIVRKDE